MEPKEKSEQLIDKYDSLLTYLESRAKAKQCAIMEVDARLETLSAYPFGLQYYAQLEYWLEVKKELETK